MVTFWLSVLMTFLCGSHVFATEPALERQVKPFIVVYSGCTGSSAFIQILEEQEDILVVGFEPFEKYLYDYACGHFQKDLSPAEIQTCLDTNTGANRPGVDKRMELRASGDPYFVYQAQLQNELFDHILAFEDTDFDVWLKTLQVDYSFVNVEDHFVRDFKPFVNRTKAIGFKVRPGAILDPQHWHTRIIENDIRLLMVERQNSIEAGMCIYKKVNLHVDQFTTEENKTAVVDDRLTVSPEAMQESINNHRHRGKVVVRWLVEAQKFALGLNYHLTVFTVEYDKEIKPADHTDALDIFYKVVELPVSPPHASPNKPGWRKKLHRTVPYQHVCELFTNYEEWAKFFADTDNSEQQFIPPLTPSNPSMAKCLEEQL
jgi:hypothetical protein